MLNPLIDPLEILTDALREKRPLVLFAGQGLDSAHDAILGALLDRFGCTDRNSGWCAVLKQDMSAVDMEWLSERFDRSVPSDSAIPIFDVAWSAVFTSSIDPRFARRFETRGRQPESVLSRDTYARVPRSRSRPPIHYLLGKSNETAEEARAPRKQSDLQRRLSGHATELLNRIAETATVRGLVVIAGYDSSKDWMPIDSLLAPLSGQFSPKVLWFGSSGKPDSIFADEMIEQGALIETTTTLASAISQLELRGVLDVSGSATPDEPGMVSITGETALDITPALRLRVEASAAIVDDGWTEEPEPLGESELDDAFRRFHSTLGNFRLLVEGVSRGFAVEREFEQTLWNTVNSKLKRLGQPDSDDVVVLHGQSGTGKSIALARLARKIRCGLRLPVVIATNRIPSHADIEAFCLESERLGAMATVLICDASQAPQRYDDLASALRSLGRRLLIIGTCYRMEPHTSGKLDRLVEAPSRVSPDELSAFKELLSKFGHDVLPSYNPPTTDSIFAMLYRRLPSSRERLAAGVSSEARATEGLVRERARQVPRPSTVLPPIAEQLIELGIASRTSQVFEEDEKLAALGLDQAGRLIDYVMVAGRLNCPVPVNIVFRALGQIDGLHQDQIIYLLADLDLFRWDEDGEGSDFLISPRIQLEAELICRRRLSPDQEIERLIDLIGSVRFGVDKRAEHTFLLDLLFMIDRNGPRKEAYRSGYLRFADALKQLREHNRVSDPDLVLRECVFRRRAVFRSQSDYDANRNDEEQFAILDEARDTVEKTLRQIEDEKIPVSRKTKQSLVAERSAIYGYLAVQRAQSDAGEDFWSDYLAARTASEKAIGLGRNSHPIDIALWTASDVLELKKGELSDVQCAEMLADLYATIDVADDVFRVNEQSARTPNTLHKDSDPDEGLVALDQKARYLERRSRVASVIGDAKLSDETLAELESVAPAAATFLIAKRRAEHVYMSKPPFDEKTRKSAAKAADYISSRANAGIELDDRCQRLLLRLRWAQATGERLMFNQRGRTPADSGQIFDLREIVSALNEQAGTDARNRERFLEAVLCWLLKDTNHAIEIWRYLSHDTEYEDRSRVVRWLVATDENGSPRQFRGRVEARGENDWWVRVEGIDKPIRVPTREFSNDDLAHGRELRNFGIAFNYIGPIADPLSRPGRRR